MIIGSGGHARVVREFAPWWKRGAVLAIGDNQERRNAALRFSEVYCPVLIHPKATVSSKATLGRGTVVMAGAIVGPYARTGEFCIINHGASLDHDCQIGDFVHLAPGSHICGHCVIGDGTLVGVGVGIAPLAEIHEWSICKAARLDICPMPTK